MIELFVVYCKNRERTPHEQHQENHCGREYIICPIPKETGRVNNLPSLLKFFQFCQDAC